MAKENKNQKSKMTPFQLKKVLKKMKIRECRVNLNRLTVSNSVEYRDALFLKYNIRDCNVCLPRLSEKDIQEATKGKKCLAKSKQGSVRSTVCWIPTAQKNSVQILSNLDAYQKQNGILPRVGKKSSIPKSNVEPAKRQRAKSMFVDQTDQPIVPTTKQPIKTPKNVHATMDDMHFEFFNKFGSFNHGLNPKNNRQLAKPHPKPKSMWENLFDEFQAKLQAKQAKNIQKPT